MNSIMNTTAIMDKAAAHVRALYATHPCKDLPYHNQLHTEDVVQAAIQIADHYQLEETDYTAVYVAAWFHDTGYLFGLTAGHEDKGAELATAFLEQESAGAALIAAVRECILATKLPQQPSSLIGCIMCDADLFHFGTEKFKENNKLVRKEIELRLKHELPDAEWTAGNIAMMQQHHFQTDYCRTLLQKGKQENIDRLLEKQQHKQAKAMEKANEKGPDVSIPEPKDKKEKKKNKNRPERGIETMFRTTSTNHLRLSEMADSKANILVTVNSIIISVLVTVLFRKLEADPHLLIPSVLFLATSLTTIIFSILVTRPNVTRGTFTKEDINAKRANLLFFGNFYKMSLEEYNEGISAMMNDSEFLYGSMTRDIYNLGVVLGRKYRLLRVAYSIFMFGLVISSLSFLLAVTVFR
jgi:predicted metal-dependent HD superfamily phosphohydrolase